MEEDSSGVQTAGEMSLLARKLRASRPGQGPMDVLEEHSIRLAMARAGRKTLDSDVMVTSVARAYVGIPADLGLSLSSKSLVSGLLSTEGDQGVIAVDASVVDAVTSLRTTGVLPRSEAVDEDVEKTATSIQAALMRPFLTLFLVSWAVAASSARGRKDPGTGDLITGYSIGNPVSTARTLLLAMPPGEMIRFTIVVELGGRVAGEVLVAFPVRRIEPAASSPGGAAFSAREAPEWAQHYRNSVLESQAALTAILHKMPISLDEINALREGSMIVLPEQCLENVLLEPKGSGPQLRGRLGKISGSRAIRLKGTVPKQPDIAHHVDLTRESAAASEGSRNTLDQNSLGFVVEKAVAPRDDEARSDVQSSDNVRDLPSVQDL